MGGWWSCVARVMLWIPGETSHRVHRVSLDLSHLFFIPQVDTCIDRLHIDFSAHNKLLINTPPNCVSVFISRPTLIEISQICETQWPQPPLFSLSWLIQWSMRDGSYITLFSPCVSWVLLCMPLGQTDSKNTYRWTITWSQCCRIRPTINARCTSQQTWDVDPMLF